MSAVELQELELEVTAARTRFATDLARLRAVDVGPGLKNDLWTVARDSKDEIIRNSSDAIKDAARRVMSDVRDKAIANPGAVVIIGAGLAWHMIRRPPISSLLVGAGIIRLMRTPAWQGRGGSFGDNLKSQATALAISAKETGQDWAAAAVEAAHEGMDSAVGTVSASVAEASQKLDGIGEVARAYITQVSNNAATDAGRDQILLGAAVVMIASALTVAWRRRSGKA